jgi:hypothetical protein
MTIIYPHNHPHISSCFGALIHIPKMIICRAIDRQEKNSYTFPRAILFTTAFGI